MKEYILPKKIECFLTLPKIPVVNLMLWAEFSTVRKNPYTIVFGPIDLQGVASISYEGIKQQADIQIALALMDFDPIEKAFSGTISIKIMTNEDLKNAMRAYDLFKTVGWYPAKYKEKMKNASKMLVTIDASAIKIDVVITPIEDASNYNILV